MSDVREFMATSPRCPECGWHLEFVPYNVAYIGNDLDIWEGVCSNVRRSDSQPGCDYGQTCNSGRRSVRPSLATHTRRSPSRGRA